jgi:hypothetical protein
MYRDLDMEGTRRGSSCRPAGRGGRRLHYKRFLPSAPQGDGGIVSSLLPPGQRARRADEGERPVPRVFETSNHPGRLPAGRVSAFDGKKKRDSSLNATAVGSCMCRAQALPGCRPPPTPCRWGQRFPGLHPATHTEPTRLEPHNRAGPRPTKTPSAPPDRRWYRARSHQKRGLSAGVLFPLRRGETGGSTSSIRAGPFDPPCPPSEGEEGCSPLF